MAVASCPHCQAHLQINPDFSGQTLQCPKCRGALVAPIFDPTPEHREEVSPLVILACAVAVNVVLWLLFAIMASPGAAVVGVGVAVLIELAIWKRERVLSIFHQVRESEATKQFLEKTASHARRGVETVHARVTQAGTPSRDEAIVAEVVDEADDELVEVRPAKTASSRPNAAIHIREPRARRERAPMWGKLSGKPLNAKFPTDNIYFYGPGTELDLGRGVLKWPLVYVTGAPQQGSFDASLIDGTLPVAPSGAVVREGLPYWPNYYDCSPAQRSRYLDWLLSGKSDPDAELGYVFIYFYGLERRVLLDQADHIPIAQELIRLLPIYDSSNSFRRYVSTLLWLTLYLASRAVAVPETLLVDAINVTGRWNNELLGMYLAILYSEQQHLPASAAYLVGENDSRSSSSVIIRRHRDEFRSLFEAKYHKHYGDGLLLRASKRLRRIQYRPASATLLRGLGTLDDLSLPEMPDILAVSSQFKHIVQLWEESIAELKAFSRASRDADGNLTADAYEALPPELQDGDHPEADAWMQAWESHVDDQDWPIVPISTLASIKGISPRDKLTKAQCSRLLRSADAIGIGVEPDARLTGRNYRWNECVTLFFLDEGGGGDTTSYNAAAVLLRLGASIAEADGEVHDEELTFISEHLEGQFNLSDADSKRLERLQYLLLHSRSGENTISKTLAKRLPREHRLLVGEFLVGVAASDEVITKEEIRALRKAYRSLDLEVADLDKLLARYAAPEREGEGVAPTESEVNLDVEAISRIMTETRQVANILRDAMAEDDEAEVSSSGAVDTAVAVLDDPSPDSSANTTERDLAVHGDLESRYQPFLQAVLGQAEWTSEELRDVADSCHVMMSGAVETINEWSMERYGDWLIEEGDTYHVHRQLIEEAA